MTTTGTRQGAIHSASLANPESFWDEAAQSIIWDVPYTSVLKPDGDPTSPDWFHGGKLSVYFNMVDRHVLEGNCLQTSKEPDLI
jgi:propionyl-CoA synthetase